MGKIKILSIALLFLCTFLYEARAEEVLTWQDCLREAAKNNPDLIASKEVVNQQKAGKEITASGLYPQVDASMSASTTKKDVIGGGSTTTKSYSYGVSGTQLIFDGVKTINNIKAASEDIKAAQESYRFTSSEVRLSLRTAFVNLLKAQELINVAEDIVNIRRSNLILITLRYESGMEHKGALLTAEANMAEANFELAQAKRNVEFSQRQLSKEMGQKKFKPLYAKGDFVVVEAVKGKPDLEEIVKTNPQVLQYIAKKNSALFNIKSTYGNFSPQFSGSVGASKSNANWPPKDNQLNAGLSLTMPLFEGGLRIAQLSQAKALYSQAEANERSIRDAAIVNLEQTWTTLQDDIETIDVQKKSLEAAEERSKIAEAQYSTGFIDFDSWIIIQDSLVNAKRSYLQAQANALIAEAGWIEAKGETLEYAQ
ncbi:MAG: TolC family protein [Candidatus Omnitrophica bacterium]|nr:TolC family protein [Candidatus Omnitrophota bacterium]